MLKKLLLSISIVFCLFLTSSFAETNQTENSKEIKIQSGIAGKIKKVYIKKGQQVFSGDKLISLTAKKELIYVRSGVSGKVLSISVEPYQKIYPEDILAIIQSQAVIIEKTEVSQDSELPALSEMLVSLLQSTGIYSLILANQYSLNEGLGTVAMILVGLLILLRLDNGKCLYFPRDSRANINSFFFKNLLSFFNINFFDFACYTTLNFYFFTIFCLVCFSKTTCQK